MNYINKLREKSGFTLVELLIVIAVIAILAIAVLAALDPIEQLKKSRDSGRLADARELYSAYTRYYASFGCYPSEQSGNTCPDNSNNQYVFLSSGDTTIDNDLATLVTAGELKSVFPTKPNIADLRIDQDDNDSMAVCFTPESKSARQGGMGEVVNTSFVNSTCVDPIGTGFNDTCAICVR
jgi:prepilin-type N-terminal cleavage/methylation domain-containing protein